MQMQNAGGLGNLMLRIVSLCTLEYNHSYTETLLAQESHISSSSRFTLAMAQMVEKDVHTYARK